MCGLRWSPDGRHLASGGNDNVLCVWDAALADHNVGNPLLSLSQHQAAVKVQLSILIFPHFRLLT